MGLIENLQHARFICALLWLADFRAILSALDKVSLRHVAAGLLLVHVRIIVSAARWYFTARRLSFSMSRLQALRESYVATASTNLVIVTI